MPSQWVVDVSESEFAERVIEGSRKRTVVVDFWAEWCQPCKMLAPMLEKLAAERDGGFLLAKVNIDAAPNLAAQFGIASIPAVLAFRGGQVIDHFVGVMPEPQLAEFVNRICPTEADRWAAEAAELEESDTAGAEANYRRALELDAGHEAATVGLARVLIARRDDAAARELLDQLLGGGEFGSEIERLKGILFLRELGASMGDEETARQRLEQHPEDPEAHYRLGCILAAAARYPEALEMLLRAAERNKEFAKTQVREVMVQVFYAVGARNELADDYRGKLARLLY